MADYRQNNYILMELAHLSYLVRDSLEYCHAQINVTQETFDRRAAMSENMLAEGNFVEKWLNGHPKEEVRQFYPQLVNYFTNIYKNEGYVSFTTRKVDPDKIVDFVEETLKCYQAVENILKAFYTEYKKTPEIIDDRIDRCVITSFDFFRVVANWLFFGEIIRNDGEYKKALKASNNQPSYEVNYNLNVLKRLIGGFNFNRQNYSGDKVDIKNMFDATMNAFKALDGTLLKDFEAKNGRKATIEEAQEMVKTAVEEGRNSCVNAIRLYEPIWRQTYAEAINYMKENPMTPAANAENSNA